MGHGRGCRSHDDHTSPRSFAQIAAWSEDEIAVLDKELKLMGRVGREAWVAQAKRLAGA